MKDFAQHFCFPLSAFCLRCRTVGVSKTTGGYAEVAPTVAAEMILDSQQVVVIDVRPSSAYRGPEGHIAGCAQRAVRDHRAAAARAAAVSEPDRARVRRDRRPTARWRRNC